MKSKAVFIALILGFLASASFADDKVIVLELKGALGVDLPKLLESAAGVDKDGQA